MTTEYVLPLFWSPQAGWMALGMWLALVAALRCIAVAVETDEHYRGVYRQGVRLWCQWGGTKPYILAALWVVIWAGAFQALQFVLILLVSRS